MKTFEEFKHSPELYGSEQIIQEDVLLYPTYVEYVKKEMAREISDYIHSEVLFYINDCKMTEYLVNHFTHLFLRYGIEADAWETAKVEEESK